jgi:hypothetical protein
VIEDNLRKVPGEVKHPVKNVSSVFKDEKENILGGIIGTIFCYYQHIDFLWVDETLRVTVIERSYYEALRNRHDQSMQFDSTGYVQFPQGDRVLGLVLA